MWRYLLHQHDLVLNLAHIYVIDIIHKFFFTNGYFENSRFCENLKGSDFVSVHSYNHGKPLLNGPLGVYIYKGERVR